MGNISSTDRIVVPKDSGVVEEGDEHGEAGVEDEDERCLLFRIGGSELEHDTEAKAGDNFFPAHTALLVGAACSSSIAARSRACILSALVEAATMLEGKDAEVACGS